MITPETPDAPEDEVGADKWKAGKHGGKQPKHKPDPKPFQYQVEYDTFTDPIYKLKDLTVRSYIKLAHRIGQYKPEKGDQIEDVDEDSNDSSDDSDDEIDADKNKKKKHRKKKASQAA
jgi:endopolyphosphatase